MVPFRVLVMLIGLASQARGETTDAAALAQAFCDAARNGDEAAAEAMMTPDLQSGIAAQREANAAFAKAYPGDKPPLGDGLRLTAFPDYPESYAPTAVTASEAELVHAPAGQSAAAWRDRIEITTGPAGGLLTSDILYAPDHKHRFSA